MFCILIIFNNPVFLSKYSALIQTHTTQIENMILIWFSKIIRAQKTITN